jgi:hypothetical protein
MQNLASAEIKLIKHQASLSSPLQSNPVLGLNTARKTGQFLGATEKNTILIEIFKTQVALSSIISANPLLSLKGVVKTANTALIGKQYGSVILEYYISTTVEDTAAHAAPVLMTATLTGKHIGNTLPSIPRLLGIQKAEIVSNTSSLVSTLPAISVGLITERGLYNGALNGNELKFIIHAVSQTALLHGQIEMIWIKGLLLQHL